MKNLVLGVLVLGFFGAAEAAKAEVGLGITSASHGSGISVDKSLGSSSDEVQGALSLFKHGFSVQGDYLVKDPLNTYVHAYAGGGLRLNSYNDTVTARVPVGIEGVLGTLPLEAGFEVAPSLALKKSNKLYLDLAVNLRYLFN